MKEMKALIRIPTDRWEGFRAPPLPPFSPGGWVVGGRLFGTPVAAPTMIGGRGGLYIGIEGGQFSTSKFRTIKVGPDCTNNDWRAKGGVLLAEEKEGMR